MKKIDQMTKTELAERERRKKEKFKVNFSNLTLNTLLTKEQCATIAKVSVSTVKNWYLRDGLVFFKPSRVVLIKYSDLVDFIDRHKQVMQPIFKHNKVKNWRKMYDRMFAHICRYPRRCL